jgi:transcriptional antiterminator NusG
MSIEESIASEKPGMKWYVVQTHSGYEAKVRDSLAQRIKQQHMEDSFGEVLIPTEQVTETRPGGKTRVRQKLSLPGYLFLEMKMSEKAWYLVKETPKVSGFVGNQNPREVPSSQIENLRRGIVEGTAKPKPRLTFEVGEEVRVLDGAFANFTGTVDDVKMDKQKLKVKVSIFGRPTSVELDFAAVEKR